MARTPRPAGETAAAVTVRESDNGTCMSQQSTADLLILKELVESNKVKPVIDRTYALSATAQALRYLEEGHARGKVVITVQRG